MKSPRIIAVAGNMGAGKSSLVDWLRHQFDMVPFFEPHDENPYLADFYGDMRRWSLHSQTFFLVRRFQIHRAISRRMETDARPIVQDRTLYEDAEVFAAHLHEAGHLDDRDWGMYQDLYLTLRDEIRPPDLMIYLRCPLKTLTQQRIRKPAAARPSAPSRGLPRFSLERASLRSLVRPLRRLAVAWSSRPTASTMSRGSSIGSRSAKRSTNASAENCRPGASSFDDGRMNLFTDFPALKAYALASVLVGLNMIILAAMTGAARGKTKSFNNTEDARGSPVNVEHERVARLKRAQQNAIESAIMFYPIALLYVLSGVSETGARAYCFTYAGARILTTSFYLAGKQPWRTIMYVIGTLAIVGMMVHLVRVAVGSWAR